MGCIPDCRTLRGYGRCRNPADASDSSKGLAATYRRILEKISQSTGGAAKVATAQKLFKWIICARRPLQIDELKEAVGIDSTDTFWDTDKIVTDGMRLIQCCGNLIVFDKNDKTV